jgi:hypothetical protein
MSVQQDQFYEDEAHLQDQHGELLLDLNEKHAYEQEDEIVHLQKDQLYEDEAYLQGQPLHLHHNERLGLHVIDSNVAASEGEQEHHEGDSLDRIWTTIRTSSVGIVVLAVAWLVPVGVGPTLGPST